MSGLAGFMRGPSGRSWWLYRYGVPALVVDLDGDQLRFVVADVDDPSGTASRIEAAVKGTC